MPENTKAIAENVHILSQVVRDVCEKKYLAEVAPDFLTNTHFAILRILNSSGPLTVSKIADLLQISRAATSKNIETLYQNKMISRKEVINILVDYLI